VARFPTGIARNVSGLAGLEVVLRVEDFEDLNREDDSICSVR
jgi:hypothetical protein